MALSGCTERPVIRQEAAASEMKQAADDSRTRTETVSRHRSLCCRSCWWLLFLLLVLLMLTVDSAAASCSPKQLRVQQFEDVGAKAYLSPVVFKGYVKSRTPVDAHGLYEASFLILKPLKGFTHPQPKKRRRRLQFETPTSSNSGVACRQGVVAALDVNATYLVFAERASQHQFRPLAPPLLATKRHEDAVEGLLGPTFKIKYPTVTLQNVTVGTKLKLKLTCHYDGNPLPLIEWYKRGRRIEPTKRTKIVNRKRRSVLTIARVSDKDAGWYECKAVSVTEVIACASAHVTVNNEHGPVFPPPKFKPPTFQPPTRFGENTTLNPSHNPYESSLCPVDSYCLNGGTCLFYEVVGELVCKCAEGYKGKRCENKDFYNRGSSMYQKKMRPFSCKLGYSSSFYC
ncbi:protein vein isoform X2 [Cloeon dipterum]|uniref:protein vein isoform X2 n=1 Tax=Cloeon dipterum TaxID=197152 RepID=UPI0032207B69